jgi:hypothetical protein
MPITLARRQRRPVLALHPPLVVDAGEQHVYFSIGELVTLETFYDAAAVVGILELYKLVELFFNCILNQTLLWWNISTLSSLVAVVVLEYRLKYFIIFIFKPHNLLHGGL